MSLSNVTLRAESHQLPGSLWGRWSYRNGSLGLRHVNTQPFGIWEAHQSWVPHPSATGQVTMRLGSQTSFSFICYGPGRGRIVPHSPHYHCPLLPFPYSLLGKEAVIFTASGSLSEQCQEGWSICPWTSGSRIGGFSELVLRLPVCPLWSHKTICPVGKLENSLHQGLDSALLSLQRLAHRSTSRSLWSMGWRVEAQALGSPWRR